MEMKKLLACLVVLAFLLAPAMAMAEKTYDPGVALPDGATEVEHWELVNGEWVHHDPDDILSLARCWRSGGAQGACNREQWELGFTHHASMAQWLDWSVGGTRWDWRILKPGTYAADCIEFRIQSNNDVDVLFSGFGDLQYLGQGGVKQTIDTYYSYGESIAQADKLGWFRAARLNEGIFIGDSATLHSGITTKLFNKIVVENCNSSCEYENSGLITIRIKNLKHWVDPTTGLWADLVTQPGE